MSFYKLKQLEKTPYYEVTIVGDYNDADYSTTIEQYDEESFKEMVPYLYLLLKDYSGIHELKDYPHSEWVSLPYSVNGRSHTLKEVKVMYYDENHKAYIVGFEINEENTEKMYEMIED